MTFPTHYLKVLRKTLEVNADEDGALVPFIQALQDIVPVPTGNVAGDLKHPGVAKSAYAFTGSREGRATRMRPAACER